MGYRYHIAHIDQRKKIETKKIPHGTHTWLCFMDVHVAVWRVVLEAFRIYSKRLEDFAYSGTSSLLSLAPPEGRD